MRRRVYETSAVLTHWEHIRASAYVGSDHFSLFAGDALQVLKGLPSNSVSTCLTSPPYWSVRDYEGIGQIGLEETAEDYVKNIVDVLREVKRVLRPEGTVWLNIGDKYLNGMPPTTGWQRNKQLSLIPFRVALALQDDGWWVRNSVVWSKPNGMPTSVVDRLSNNWEPMFLLTKDEYYYFNLDRIRVPHKTDDAVERIRAERGQVAGKAKGNAALRQWLNSPRHRATIDGVKEIGRRVNAPDPVELAIYLKAAGERVGLSVKDVAKALDQPFERVRHYFRTDRIGSRLPPEDTWERLQEILLLDGTYDEAMTIEYGDNVFRNHPRGRNPGDVQSFAVASTAGQHYATMPLALAQWCLNATLPPGGVCLDPFMGHGTTGKAALSLGGRFVGIDLMTEYVNETARTLAKDESDALAAAGKLTPDKAKIGVSL